MIEVKRPVLLDANLKDAAMLHPTKGTLKLTMEGVSEATLTLEDRAETVPMHGWVRLYNQLGFAGYFRRSSRGRNIGTDNSYTLRHGIDILQDSIWDAETTFTGTMTQFLTALLDKQTHLIQGPGDDAPRKPWALSSCADTSTVTKEINYDNLMDLFEECVTQGGDYYFTYDQTVWPWTVSLVAKPSAVASEFRLERNVEKCSIKDNDSELCTRLILNVNAMENDETLADYTDITVKQNNSGYRVYNNTTAQASYGIIVKTADIDIAGPIPADPTDPCAEADAWAADFLARRAAPTLQVEIDGQVLKGLTGDSWDESRIGTMVRVALPEYGDPVTERCVTVSYPDLYGTPDRVTVSLANALPTFTRTMKQTQRTLARHSRSGRSSAREAKNFVQHFEITDKAGNILKQAGLQLDADGLLVYANDNVNMIGSRFNVQADQIGMVVGYTDSVGNYIKAGEICLSINSSGDTNAVINASKIYLLGQTIADTITANYIQTQISSVTSLSANNFTTTGEVYVKNGAGQSTSLRNAIAELQIVSVSGGYRLQYARFNQNGWSYAPGTITIPT